MEYYFGVAREQGITKEEICAVQNIVMAVAAGRISAQFGEARAKSRKAARAAEEGSC